MLELIAGVVVAFVAVAVVLEPLISPRGARPVDRALDETDFVDIEESESPKIQALLALKEIEFDRETGKLSDGDYAELYARYSAEAIEAMRAEDASAAPATAPASVGTGDAIEAMVAADVLTLEAAAGSATGAPACPTCGPRPESDAVFCSRCGKLLPHPAQCSKCNTPLEPGGKFCGRCGTTVSELAG